MAVRGSGSASGPQRGSRKAKRVNRPAPKSTLRRAVRQALPKPAPRRPDRRPTQAERKVTRKVKTRAKREVQERSRPTAGARGAVAGSRTGRFAEVVRLAERGESVPSRGPATGLRLPDKPGRVPVAALRKKEDLVRSLPKSTEGREFSRRDKARRAEAFRTATAPAVKVLDTVSYPGRQIGRGVERGLKAAGAPKEIQTAGRLVGEFVLDPLNYVTAGKGTVVRKGLKAASEAGAETSTRRGIQVGLRARVPFTTKGFDVKTSGRASAAVANTRPVKAVRRKVRESKAVQAVGETFAPDFRPKHVRPGQQETVRKAVREHRAAEASSERRVVKETRGLRKAVKNRGKDVRDVIERAPANVERHLSDLRQYERGLEELPKAQRQVARTTQRARSALRGATQPVRSRELVAAEKVVERARRARAKVERSPARTAERVKAGRARVREAEAKLQAVRDRTPTLTRKQADRIVFARADQAVAETKALAEAKRVRDAERRLGENRVREADLPPELRATALNLSAKYDAMQAAEEARGIGRGRFTPEGPGDAQGFFPHVSRVLTEEGGEGGGAIKVSKTKGRQIRESQKVVEARDPSIFEDDIAKVYAHRARETDRRVHLADLWKKVAGTGRPLTDDAEILWDKKGGRFEQVYEVSADGVRPLSSNATGAPDKTEIAKALSGERPGKYVILDERVVEGVERALRNPTSHPTPIGRVFDRVTGTWKLAATVYSPVTYQVRNAIGDSINAFLGDAGIRDFISSARALKVLKSRESRRGSAEMWTKVDDSARDALNQTVKIRGKKVRVIDELEAAERLGAIRTGQAGAEFRELLGGDPARAGRIRAFSEYREDFPRFASFFAARRRGMTHDEAAKWSLKHHFDYGDLTHAEMGVLRRAFPFYTFWARNTRLQVEKLFTRPGKYAQLGKVLDETARAAGFRDYDDYQGRLTETQQRGIPIPLKVPNGIPLVGGGVFNVFYSPPAADLNQLTMSPDQQFQNVGNRLTFFKAFPEILANYSIFFQGEIEKLGRPLVPAPDVVEHLPKVLRDKLGIKQFVYHGEKIWGWPGKLDYASRSVLPQINQLTQFATTSRGSRGVSQKETAFGFATGLRVVRLDEAKNRLNKLYEEKSEATERLRSIQQELGKESGEYEYRETDETKKLKKRIKELDREIGQSRLERGDPANELPPTQRPKRRGARRSDGGGWGAASGTSGGGWGAASDF